MPFFPLEPKFLPHVTLSFSKSTSSFSLPSATGVFIIHFCLISSISFLSRGIVCAWPFISLFALLKKTLLTSSIWHSSAGQLFYSSALPLVSMLDHMSRRSRSMLSLFLTSLALALSVLAFCTSYWCEGTHKVVKPLCLSPVKMKNCGQNDSEPYTTG